MSKRTLYDEFTEEALQNQRAAEIAYAFENCRSIKQLSEESCFSLMSVGEFITLAHDAREQMRQRGELS